MHSTIKQYYTREEMKRNAMQWKKWTKDSDIGLLVFLWGRDEWQICSS